MKNQNHIHTYDESGKMACCSLEEKINAQTPALIVPKKKEHHDGDNHDHSHDGVMRWRAYLPALISLVLLLSGLAIEHLVNAPFFDGWIKIIWYSAAYLPVGLPVMKEAWEALRKGEVFTEFFLMSIATIGAFAIGEYPEGVAVMLFYAIGELFQTAAVKRAKNNIKALLDVRPNTASVLKNGNYQIVDHETVQIGDTIQVKVGEKIPLDGTLLSEKATLNTAALTGESKPQNTLKGEKVMAGSINLDGVVKLKVEKLFNDSSIARILELVQNATAKKSKTELLIRRLAKIYTPIVVYLAIAILVLPYFFMADYQFKDWLYRALILLVISCPCALVISIPLGYFGGLGAASKNGLLFKGATYLDQLTKVNTLVMDKTGTVTKGVFKIKDIVISGNFSEGEFMKLLMAIEVKSTHPIAKAIMEYATDAQQLEATNIQEIAGKGLKGDVGGKTIIVGNKKLMEQFNVTVPSETDTIVESIVMVGINGQFAGYVTIADELKKDAKELILQLRAAGIQHFTMLSGDKDSITQQVAQELGITDAKGGLLPEDKLNEVERIKQDKTKVVAFVGDGINDAPALAQADVGIAVGSGTDVAAETADIILVNSNPQDIAKLILFGKATYKKMIQNLIWATGYNAIAIPLAIGILYPWGFVLSPAVGAVFMSLSTIIVAINAQLLKTSITK